MYIPTMLHSSMKSGIFWVSLIWLKSNSNDWKRFWPITSGLNSSLTKPWGSLDLLIFKEANIFRIWSSLHFKDLFWSEYSNRFCHNCSFKYFRRLYSWVTQPLNKSVKITSFYQTFSCDYFPFTVLLSCNFIQTFLLSVAHFN